METRLFAFIVLITVVMTGIFIWFSSIHNHNNDFTIPFVLSVLFTLSFKILTELPGSPFAHKSWRGEGPGWTSNDCVGN